LEPGRTAEAIELFCYQARRMTYAAVPVMRHTRRRTTMAIGNNRLKNTGAEVASALKQSVRDTVRRTDVDGPRISGGPMGGAHGFDAFEVDFHSHHHTNAARRRGPYEHYRLVYRYGYDLGTDPRYRNADWSDVERDARPRWEERNPGTWLEFKETIRYAWDTARDRH
jgi:hypothetical protein